MGCSLAGRVSDAEGLRSPGARPSQGKPRGQLQHDCGNGEILFALFNAEADKKTQRYRTGSGLWYFLSLSFPQFLQQPMKINKGPVLTLPDARVLGVPVPPPSSHPPNSSTESQLVSKKLQKFTWPLQRCRTRPCCRARALWGSCGHGQPERSPAPPAGGRHPSAHPPRRHARWARRGFLQASCTMIDRQCPLRKPLFIRTTLPPANQLMQIPIRFGFLPVPQQSSTQQDASTLAG